MKIIFKKFLFVFILVCLFISCGNETDNTNEGNEVEKLKTGKVTFFNESSYTVKVHRDSFSGTVITQLSAGQTKTENVVISDSHGLGTTFSIEYLYKVTDGFDAESGEIFASGLDFNVQINRAIEENKSITIQIPQPGALEFRTAFMKILNSHNLPMELRYYGQSLKQAGNGLYPIASGKTGVYTLSELAMGGIPAGGEFEFTGFNIGSGMSTITVPAFNAQNGVIYNFTFNGSSVVKTGEQTIIF